jgi:hypothetical protein
LPRKQPRAAAKGPQGQWDRVLSPPFVFLFPCLLCLPCSQRRHYFLPIAVFVPTPHKDGEVQYPYPPAPQQCRVVVPFYRFNLLTINVNKANNFRHNIRAKHIQEAFSVAPGCRIYSRNGVPREGDETKKPHSVQHCFTHTKGGTNNDPTPVTEHKRRLTPLDRKAVCPLSAVATVVGRGGHSGVGRTAAEDSVLPCPDPQLQQQPPERARTLGQARPVGVCKQQIRGAVQVRPPPPAHRCPWKNLVSSDFPIIEQQMVGQ